MYTLKLGKSIDFVSDADAILDDCAKNHIESIDYNLCSFWQDAVQEREYFKDIEKVCARIRDKDFIFNAVHMSFGFCWDLSETDEQTRKQILENHIKLMMRVKPYKPAYVVVHGSFEPVDASRRADKLSALIRSVTEISEVVDIPLCIENLPRTCLCNTSEELLYVTNKAAVDVCLDTNHFLSEQPEEAILKLGTKIKTLHISDYDFINERHWLPGRGIINWNRLLHNLERTGYNGVFNYETVSASCAEIYENYAELFAAYNRSANP